jgi:glutaconate CoA-transferase subunit A
MSAPAKVMSIEEIVGSLASGMTIGIGGWGSRRKPMALVRAICRSPLTDLTVISYGGPDVGLLCAYGKVRRVIAPFVTLDSIALEPHFRGARRSGSIAFTEYDEDLRTVRSPYDDGEELVAMPALSMDVALVHMNRADARGNARYLGPDPYLDDLFVKAATTASYVSCERLVDTDDLLDDGHVQSLLISRVHVTGVTETPRGAHFTTCEPDHGRDEAFQREYVKAAADAAEWQAFRRRYLDGDEKAYQEAIQ